MYFGDFMVMQDVSKKKLSQLIEELLESYWYSKEHNLYRFIIKTAEKPLIESVLLRTEGNQLKAARILGINRNTLRSKIRKLGIQIK
jgi:two-component system nitrogen regulation response regulator GlnG